MTSAANDAQGAGWYKNSQGFKKKKEKIGEQRFKKPKERDWVGGGGGGSVLLKSK